MATNYGTSAYQSKTQKAFTASQAALDAKRGVSYNAADIAAGARAILKPVTATADTTPSSAPKAEPLFPDNSNPIQDKLDQAVQSKQPAASLDTRTGNELLNAELATGANNAFNLTGAKTPGSIGEVVQQTKDQQEQAKQRLLQQQQSQLDVQGLQYQQATNAMNSAQAAGIANLAQGREGVMSAGRAPAMENLKLVYAQKKAILDTQVTQTNNELMQAQADLERANNEQNTTLANNIQSRIGQLKAQQQQNNDAILQHATEAVKVELAQSEEKRAQEAQKMSNLNTFKGFLTEGIELPASAIQSFANTAGLDGGMLAQAYLGAQSIRMDKNLSREEKAAKLADLQIDLDRKQKGLDDEALRSTATLQAMYKRGASAQEIADYKSAAKITDQNDPVYQAELKYKQAQIEATKTGSTLDKARAAQLFKELQDANGSSTTYLPSGTTFNITTTANGISVGAKDGTEGGQCGRFVNNVFGVASFFGDSYEDKKKKIDSMMPAPGMAFVMPAYGKYAPNGHVGIVESVNADGSFNVVDSNRAAPNTIGRKTLTVNDVDGFVKPPNAEVIGGSQNVNIQEITPDQINMFRSWDGKTVPKAWGGSAESFKRAYNDFQKKLTDPNISLSDKMRFSTGGKELLDKQSQKMDSFAMVVTGLQSLEKNLASVDTNELAPLVGIIQNNNPWDDKRKEIDAILTSIVPGLARGVYGEVGVLTDVDVARYKSLLPTLRDTKSQREALMGLLKESLSKGVENTIRSAASSGRDVSQYTDLVDYVTKKREISPRVDLNDTSSLMRVYQSAGNAPAPAFQRSFDDAWESNQ